MLDARNFSFDEWKDQVPEAIRNERFWQWIAYPKALYLYDLLWQDTQDWMKDMRGQKLAAQIIASSDSICANIEEGYGRGYGKQLVYFYTVSLGSARETKGRIYRAKALYNSPNIIQHRITLAGEIIALLITEINIQKNR